MLSFINKHLKKPSSKEKQHKEEGEGEEKTKTKTKKKKERMETNACPQGCCLGLAEPRAVTTTTTTTTTTTRSTRSEFATSTTSTLFPDTQFTNHESLPSLPEAYSSFSRAYPQYEESREADRIREDHYPNLCSHVCLDYTGFGLFSHSQMHNSIASTSSAQPPKSQPPFFSIAFRSSSQETSLESAIKSRIMHFLNIENDDYSMLCTANRATAFKVLAESYPFRSNKRLLTVYDYESEAVSTMAETGQKRGAKVMSASFSWPGLRIQSSKLKRMLQKGQKKKKRRGLFVFPLQSRMTGARYPYIWMRLAQENGWDVALDASALGPKDLDTLGLSLIQPDFIICSFFKVLGENPSGFAAIFVKKSTDSILETSAIKTSIGVVSIVPVQNSFQMTGDCSGTLSDIENSSSFSGPLCNGSGTKKYIVSDQPSSSKQSPPVHKENEPEIVELEKESRDANAEIECIGLDHADSLGLPLISSRLRYITNWLVVALMKLRHPNAEYRHPLVRIYGPRIKFERGPAIAFNVFDWKGEKVEPSLVQKLADRSNISLSCGFLRNIWFSAKYEEERDEVLERRICEKRISGNKRKEEVDLGIAVVNASLGFLANFEDAYKLWSFVAKFLDADFVEKERWRYMALNQTMVEV